jgi:hypothetical protein
MPGKNRLGAKVLYLMDFIISAPYKCCGLKLFHYFWTKSASATRKKKRDRKTQREKKEEMKREEEERNEDRDRGWKK